MKVRMHRTPDIPARQENVAFLGQLNPGDSCYSLSPCFPDCHSSVLPIFHSRLSSPFGQLWGVGEKGVEAVANNPLLWGGCRGMWCWWHVVYMNDGKWLILHLDVLMMMVLGTHLPPSDPCPPLSIPFLHALVSCGLPDLTSQRPGSSCFGKSAWLSPMDVRQLDCAELFPSSW